MPKLEVGLVDVLFFFSTPDPDPLFAASHVRIYTILCIASSYPEREAVGILNTHYQNSSYIYSVHKEVT